MTSISLYSHAVAAVSFGLLALLVSTRWRSSALAPMLMISSSMSVVWASCITVGVFTEYPPITLITITELARNISWLLFLLRLLGFQEDGDAQRWHGRRWNTVAIIGGLLALCGVLLRPASQHLPIQAEFAADTALTVMLCLSILGLLLIEQLYRNAQAPERWAIKFLCLGLGAIFAYDLFMYSEALLFRRLDPQLWQARGFVNAMVVPWLALAVARNRSWRLELYVSRHVVFHTVTLVGSGLYLLGMAVVGYFIRYLGGSWGGVLQVSFLAGSGALLLTLLFSGSLRAHLRVFLSKHFFSYRYDYRLEWLRFTDGLANPSTDVASGIIRNMAALVQSPGGVLIYRDSNEALGSVARWEHEDLPDYDLGSIPEWLERTGWVIDLSEWRQGPDVYSDLELPVWLNLSESVWLIAPLFFQSRLEALLLLSRTGLKDSINWEDRDLLKTAGRQAAALLAQQRASVALVEARQFDAFNRLSAYVIHDLKNILAQQSLIVSNAQKHKHNPAFVDDMINTVENSVRRMQRLMEQMRSGLRTGESSSLDLRDLLQEVVEGRRTSYPQPLLNASQGATITADRDRLSTVFSHLLQNAQEATDDDGRVDVQLSAADGYARVEVIDSGCGMSAEFLRERLFKPFDSTKGLTGMGIGAFESREYVRQLGGDIRVRSTPGAGSRFTVTLPLIDSSSGGERSSDALALPTEGG